MGDETPKKPADAPRRARPSARRAQPSVPPAPAAVNQVAGPPDDAPAPEDELAHDGPSDTEADEAAAEEVGSPGTELEFAL